MRRITLITGGCRSGKSRFGLELGTAVDGEKLFVATCPKLDGEMMQRIEKHQFERRSMGWQTVEEELDLAKVLHQHSQTPMILVDCLTLWINNQLFHEGSEALTETHIAERCEHLVNLCRQQAGEFIVISNEVGMGIVPENALARRFRDLSGRCQQTFAAAAERVCLMVAGVPVWVKTASSRH